MIIYKCRKFQQILPFSKDISIIVNGVLVENTEEIDDLIEKNGTIEVDFTFIQSKTSSNFSTSELNTFIFGKIFVKTVLFNKLWF